MLTFNLKKEWFEKIKTGEKTSEFRRDTEYWAKRIGPLKRGDTIRFACGYPKNSAKEKFLLARFKAAYWHGNGMHTDLKVDEPVLEVKFDLIKEDDKQ